MIPNLLNPDLAIHSGEKPQVLKAGRYSNPDCYPNNLLIDGAHAKFQNKRTTPSVILLTKIVAYLSCSAGRTHFAWTNSNVDASTVYLSVYNASALLD